MNVDRPSMERGYNLERVEIPEGKILSIPSEESGRMLDFLTISSCMAVALEFNDKSRVAMHCVRCPEEKLGQRPSHELFDTMEMLFKQKLEEGNAITKITAIGMEDFWETKDFNLVEEGSSVQDAIIAKILEEAFLKQESMDIKIGKHNLAKIEAEEHPALTFETAVVTVGETEINLEQDLVLGTTDGVEVLSGRYDLFDLVEEIKTTWKEVIYSKGDDSIPATQVSTKITKKLGYNPF